MSNELAEFQEELSRALNEAGVSAMPSWQEAIDYLASQRDDAIADTVKMRREMSALRRALEHYADERNWTNECELRRFPGFHGSSVAANALRYQR